jgi:G6PDH family F420-dependent oxidoreductase
VPDRPPRILVSGFGKRSIALAARIGDGFCTTAPDPDAVSAFRDGGGGDKPVHGSMKVCYHADAASARTIAHRLWPNEALPGELAQVLPTPAHFEQACELVTEDMVARDVPCGPSVQQHLERLARYEEAGFDIVFVQQIGPDLEGFFEVYEREVLTRYPSEATLSGASSGS